MCNGYLNVIWGFCCFKDKKAAKEREREERIAEAELENVHSARNVEAEKLKEIGRNDIVQLLVTRLAQDPHRPSNVE